MANDMLLKRICDFANASNKGELSVSAFLSPAESALAKRYLFEQKLNQRYILYGGYSEAERRVLFVLPSYTADFDGSAEEKLQTFFPDEYKSAVHALKIQGSGYRALSHRDYLGSLLSLGLERDVLGDVVVTDEYSAVVFCSEKISEFIKMSLEKVASDAVKVTDFCVGEDFSPQKKTEPVNGTVASARLDCVVSALTGLSREKAQEIIKKELCQLNYITETRCDAQIETPCILSVRGYGKYSVLELDGLTKRGRIRMSAQKYI